MALSVSLLMSDLPACSIELPAYWKSVWMRINKGIPRCSLPVVLLATVGGGKDLSMRLLLREMYASGKR